MKMVCPKCGVENRDGALYCDRCGGMLPRTDVVQPQGARDQPGNRPQPGYPCQPGYPSPEGPPGAYVSPGYGQKRAMAHEQAMQDYHRKMVISLLVLIACGIIIAVSTFMTWGSLGLGFGFKVGFSGWDVMNTEGASNPFYIRVLSSGGAVSLFSGLCTLICGILLTVLGAAVFFWRKPWLVIGVFLVAFLIFGIALVNTFNIIKIGFSLGYGTIIFLCASAGAIASGVFLRQNI